jgi:hypothetical protein
METPTLFRFWLSTRTAFASDPDLIRIAWTVQGVERSALGYLDDTRVVWNLGAEVPSRINRDALEAAWSQADYGDAHVPPGWSFEGYESASEMEHQVGCRCLECGVVQADIDCLSTHGECKKCWTRTMATQRYRICKERRTYAGIATEDTGLIVSAANAEQAVANAKQLPMFAGLKLVAIAEAA